MGAEPVVIQRENDAGRVVLDGCVGKLGVRLAKVDAMRVAEAVLAGVR